MTCVRPPILVSGCASLEMMGQLLGRTQTSSTKRNANLSDTPLRTKVHAVGEMLQPGLRLVGRRPLRVQCQTEAV